MGVLADRLNELLIQMRESDERMLRTTEELLSTTREHIRNLDQLLDEED